MSHDMTPETLSRIAKKWRWLLADDSDAIDAAADAWEADVEDKDRYLAESKRNMEGWTNCVMEIASLRNRLEEAEKALRNIASLLEACHALAGEEKP